VDGSLYRSVNRLAGRTGFAHPLFVAYAKYGVLLFAVLLLGGWWYSRGTADGRSLAAVVWGGAGALAALGAGQLIGHLMDRARPYAVMPTVHVLIDRTSDFSFPSDHATAVGAVAAGLWLANRRLGIVASLLALLMAFSRVYVGAHYPGDVLAGLLLGAGIVVGLWPVAGRLLRPVIRRLGDSPLAFLVSGSNRARS
jgi:membrane-associated phospholipid phosphatase